MEISELKQIIKTDKISGDFNQSKILVDFGEIKSSGEFFISQNEMFWTIKKPIFAEIKINEDGIFQNSKQGWIKNPNDFDKKFFMDILSLNYQSLQKSFFINLQGNSQKWSVSLSPKSKIFEKIFEKIEIFGSKFVNGFNIFEKNGDKTFIEFSNIKDEKL